MNCVRLMEQMAVRMMQWFVEHMADKVIKEWHIGLKAHGTMFLMMISGSQNA